MNSYCEVALHISWEQETLTYFCREFTEIKVGCRVEVPLRGEIVSGIVIALHNQEPNYKTFPIFKVIDLDPVLNAEQLDLARWMQENYLCSLGEAIFKMIPKGKRKNQIKNSLVTSSVKSSLHALNDEQKKAKEAIQTQKQNTHLLFGITGSGKTEVYLSLISDVLEENEKNTVIYLIPEVGLTISAFDKLNSIFPGQVALLHSYLKTKERFQNYLDILQKRKRIVVGTRSAIFAPVSHLALVVIDEEHDGSYKEFSSPRYHARQIALHRILDSNGKLVLGSATPSVEIFYLAKMGKIGFHQLKKRAVPGSFLPNVSIIPLTNQSISGDLQFKIKQRLDKKEQTVLFLNRRGYSPFLYSEELQGYIPCPNCTTTLCLHRDDSVKCHVCGYKTNLTKIRSTFSGNIEMHGTGTQKVEEELLQFFPQAKIERLDQDSTQKKEVLAEVLGKLSLGEIDILTGTQMIAKGLDIPGVTLVGILNANLGLSMPDFRASERVFSLLAQVAGRSGRREKPGEVVLQARDPEHPVIQMALRQDYEEFFDWEIEFRKTMLYPPFIRLLRIVFRSNEEERALRNSFQFSEILEERKKDSLVLGPAPCPFFKIDKNYRYHILIKNRSSQELRNLLKLCLQTFKNDPKCYLEIDFDPTELI